MQKSYLEMIFLFFILVELLTVSTTTALKSNHLTTSNRTQVVHKVSKTHYSISVSLNSITSIYIFPNLGDDREFYLYSI